MSTQSIKEIDIDTIKNNLNDIVMCTGNRMIVADSFGVSNKISKLDLFKLTYFKRFLNRRYCKEEVTPETELNINKLINKLKYG